MSYRNQVLGPGQAQALLGAWQQIVGHNQNAGVPTQNYHGVYGGHQARSYRPNFGGYGAPLMGGEDFDDGGYGPPASYGPPPGPPRHWHHRGAPLARDPYGIQPRNALIDYPSPTRAERVVLPMSSGVNILPNTSAQITSRPQTVAFRPERMIIGGNAGDWIINDVKVGNRSQFTQSGDVPGEMFAATTIDSFVSFETVQTAMDFVVLVTFVGASESGAPFVCGVLGTAAV